MDRLVRRASSVLGCPLDSVEVVGNGRMMAKLSSLLNNTSHPLQDSLTALGSSFSERLLHPRCVKERCSSEARQAARRAACEEFIQTRERDSRINKTQEHEENVKKKTVSEPVSRSISRRDMLEIPLPVAGGGGAGGGGGVIAHEREEEEMLLRVADGGVLFHMIITKEDRGG
ncbi:hypothetical protein L3Q82_000830 [Scortum barcoo]|uniref:Uncharacterized protein n=1 Tax=Scortum barcoo TaxID=214431 RepID=A0ACB8WE28_9TELE|nr:hypothetical protein L3Q82_000830 [Scortum barcoo]